jgi:hypothetical protein
MNSGYGIVRPAYFNTNDCEIFYTFRENRETLTNGVLYRLNPNDVLTPQENILDGADEIFEGESTNLFGGLYHLRLPQDRFSQKGIYNIVIRPKEIRTTILDCGVLSALPSIRGIVLDVNDTNLEGRTLFDGFRIEYFNEGIKDNELFRVVSSTLRVSPVSENLSTNITQKNIKYQVNNNGDKIFLTLMPSAVNTNEQLVITPFIGKPSQEISIINTFFDPIMVEVEIVDYTLETIAPVLVGNQIKSIEDGKYIVYNPDGTVFKAYNLGDVRNEFGNPTFEYRKEITEIPDNLTDFNQFIIENNQ